MRKIILKLMVNEMTDLEQERKAFEKCAFNASGGWASFEKDSSGKYWPDKLNLAWDMWVKRAEQENEEIDSLKAQLAKIESGEFVVVPREPTSKMIHSVAELHKENCFLTYVCTYKAMIEAAQEKSRD